MDTKLTLLLNPSSGGSTGESDDLPYSNFLVKAPDGAAVGTAV
jgi:hypothetical protein